MTLPPLRGRSTKYLQSLKHAFTHTQSICLQAVGGLKHLCQKCYRICLRNCSFWPFHPRHAGSHLIWEAKQSQAYLVLGWRSCNILKYSRVPANILSSTNPTKKATVPPDMMPSIALFFVELYPIIEPYRVYSLLLLDSPPLWKTE